MIVGLLLAALDQAYIPKLPFETLNSPVSPIVVVMLLVDESLEIACP